MKESPPHLLLVCESENAANIDRRALREVGFPNIQVMTSGVKAAQLLGGQEDLPDEILPDLVICQFQLQDMEGYRFCSIIRQNPRLAKLPLLLILPNDSEPVHLKAIDCGADVFIPRPFSVDDLKQVLEILMKKVPDHRQLWQTSSHLGTFAFDEALATQGVLLQNEKTAAEFFKLGMNLLNKGRFSMATAAFYKGLDEPEILAEVQLGLAAAWRGKGDLKEFKKWLTAACDTFIAEKRWTRARAAFAKLLQIEPTAKNPFIQEARRLIRQERYPEAANAMVQGHNLIPKMKVSERYAKICMLAKDPEAMYRALASELDREGEMEFLGNEIRVELNQLIRQKEERQKEQAAERSFKLARSMGLQLDQDEQETPGEPPAKNEKPDIMDRDFEKKQKNPVSNLPKHSVAVKMDNSIEEFPISAEPEDDLFQGRSLFSDFLSMVRLTWRLDKKTKR